MPARVLLIVSVCACLSGVTHAQLSGYYTINPVLPGQDRNYTDFAAANAALATFGVSGPVTFDVFDDGGPYTGSLSVPGPLIGNRQAAVVLTPWVGVSPANRVTFRAAAGEFPVIEAQGQAFGVWMEEVDHVTLRGLEIRLAEQDGIFVHAPTGTDAVGNRFERLWIHDCGGVGIFLYGGTGEVRDTYIANCVLHTLLTNSLRGTLSGLYRDAYVASVRDSFTELRHNTIIMDAAAGFLATHAILNEPAGSLRSGITALTGNVIVQSAGSEVLRFGAALPVTSEGNVFHDTNGGTFGVFGGTPAVTVADWKRLTGLDTTSIDADPLLTGGGTVPWRLSSSSPAIGLAPATGLRARVDHDGQPRDTTLDAGADEWVPGTPKVYETNGPTAELRIANLVGSISQPALVDRVRGATASIYMASTTGLGFEAVILPAPLVGVGQGALVSPAGQVLNLDVTAQGGFWMHGGNTPDYSPTLGGTSFWNGWVTPNVIGTFSIQSQHFDPSTLDGWALSQPVELRVR